MRSIGLVFAWIVLVASSVAGQTKEPGRQQYESLCSRCHGADGNGGEMGPAIARQLALSTDDDLVALIREGRPAAGMPGFPVSAADLSSLVTHLRTLKPRRDAVPPRITVTTDTGETLQGLALNRTSTDLQLLTDDRRIHLLRRVSTEPASRPVAESPSRPESAESSSRPVAHPAGGQRPAAGGPTSSGRPDNPERYRRVTSQADWPTYNGDPKGNRYSTVDQINRANVSRLAPAWTFSLPGTSRLEVTPVVVDGVMFVTSGNECYALDAGTGRQIWHYRRPRTKGLAGDAAGGINRGVAVAGDRVFMVTDHAHLIALDRATGALLWDTEMADFRQNYGATSAPLAVGDLIVSGVSGGDEGIRGFVAAFDQRTGKEVWRFWTVPKRGEPGSETWGGNDLEHPCAATWLTGTYDADLGTLFWPTGNPCPDYDGSQRIGDNLYSDSIVALDASTGKMRWYFQYTPHDLWDWDAQQPPVLIDRDWNGQPRKLLLHANRNGFFYVLDRTSGGLLLATPFVKTLTWARGIDERGRPMLNPNQTPTAEGTRVCPAVEGATNWFSTSFNPATGLYYVQTLEKCTIYTRTPEQWQPGESFYGGSTRQSPTDPGRKILRALDVSTGAAAWELPQVGPANSWGGTMTTAGGLVFFGEDSGALVAADATDGTPLWAFQTNVLWKASPMTYVFDGRQHVAVAAGSTIIAFALVDIS